jgi:hypothetical protein
MRIVILISLMCFAAGISSPAWAAKTTPADRGAIVEKCRAQAGAGATGKSAMIKACVQREMKKKR